MFDLVNNQMEKKQCDFFRAILSSIDNMLISLTSNHIS